MSVIRLTQLPVWAIIRLELFVSLGSLFVAEICNANGDYVTILEEVFCYLLGINEYSILATPINHASCAIFGDDYGNKPGVKQAVDEFDATNDSWSLEVFSTNQFQFTRTKARP